jgi:hypothetical protein
VWTISKPLPYDVHLAGSGSATVDVTTTVPNANLVLDVYDLDANGVGPLITRQGHLVRQTGDSTIPLDLWSADWKLAAGHRLGVRVTDNNQDWWIFASPTVQTVTVRGGSVTLPFLHYRRTQTIQGDPGVQLESYLASTVTVPADTLSASQVDFTLPPALADPPPGSVYTGGYAPPLGSSAAATSTAFTATPGATKTTPAKRLRLVARLTRHGKTFTVSGAAPAKATVTVKLLRAGRTVASKRVRVSQKGAFRVTFSVKRTGTYRALVSVRSAGRTFTTRTSTARVRR